MSNTFNINGSNFTFSDSGFKIEDLNSAFLKLFYRNYKPIATPPTAESLKTDNTDLKTDNVKQSAIGNNISQVGNSLTYALTSPLTTSDNDVKRGIGLGIQQVGERVFTSVGNEVGKNITSGTKNAVSSGIKSGLKGAFSGSAGAIAGAGIALGVADTMLGLKKEYAGERGNITRGLDTAYDTISTGVNFIPGIGQGLGLAMQGLKVLGKGVGKLGAYTDGMTTQDAVLGSSFFNWNIGAINGALGNNTNAYFSNSELNAQTGGGYLGFLALDQQGERFSNKRFGLLSQGAYKKASNAVNTAISQQDTVFNIVDANAINNIGSQGSTPFVANRISTDLSGGIQQMRAARHGMKIENQLAVQRALSLYRVGGFIKAYKKGDSVEKRRAKDIETMNKRFGYNKQSTPDEGSNEEFINRLAVNQLEREDASIKRLKYVDKHSVSEKEALLRMSEPVVRDYEANVLARLHREYTDNNAPEIRQEENPLTPKRIEEKINNSYNNELNYRKLINKIPIVTDIPLSNQNSTENKPNNVEENLSIRSDLTYPYYDINKDFTEEYLNTLLNEQTINTSTQADQKVNNYNNVVSKYIDLVNSNDFLMDWDPDKLSFSEYVTEKQTRDKEGTLLDGNIFNNLYSLDLMNDDFNTAYADYVYPNTVNLTEARSKYKQMTSELKRNFFKQGILNYLQQDWALFFKKGGKVNVIPDGALHARLNHLNDVDPELAKEVTHKGIPVITEEEGGEIVLHAEIEKEEIIFNIDVTNKLEKLRKENTDESAIEAGKLLVDEIMNNTIDNTGKLI